MRALVVAGGDVPAALLQHEFAQAGLCVCADGGARHLAGRLPDILIGDMDSIEPGLLQKYEKAGVQILRAQAEKDETDAQLAVDEAIRRGATEIVLLGALGGRVDHALGNLMLLVRAGEKGVKAVIRDDTCEITAASGAVEIRGRAGDTVSLLPAGSGVSVRYLDGFKYGTKEPMKLPIDAPVGVSNVLTADRAHAGIDGWAYIVLNKGVMASRLKGANMDIGLAGFGNVSWEQDICPWNAAEKTAEHKCAVKDISLCKYFNGIEYPDRVICRYPAKK